MRQLSSLAWRHGCETKGSELNLYRPSLLFKVFGRNNFTWAKILILWTSELWAPVFFFDMNKWGASYSHSPITTGIFLHLFPCEISFVLSLTLVTQYILNDSATMRYCGRLRVTVNGTATSLKLAAGQLRATTATDRARMLNKQWPFRWVATKYISGHTSHFSVKKLKVPNGSKKLFPHCCRQEFSEYVDIKK